ncbi:MAG TPA: TolC family protein, partial [Bacteroidales bacterium]|nr:TolC family protein [Bacteroidales bacterium]
MIRQIIKFLCLTLFIGYFVSCNNFRNIESSQVKALPVSYPDSSRDTANIANINWHVYFTDTLLVDLIDTAIKNNPDMGVAIQRIEMARAHVRFAKGQQFPSISAGANAGGQKFGKYTMDAAGNRDLLIYNDQVVPEFLPDYNLGLQASWEIDLWGKIRNKKKSVLAHFWATIEGKNLAVTNLVSDVTQKYYELLALDNELEIIRRSIRLQDSALNIVRVQKQAGMANELAVKQFEAQLLNSKELEIETLQRISTGENDINLLLGRYPQT